MRGNEGFGILAVLVAAVVLTIVGVNFARKISNKAMVSKAADIIAYRDMLLEYYTSLAANRAAYKCTRTNNSAPTTSFTDIDLYDIGSGTNCTTAHKVIPIAGRDMKPWDDVAATTTIACANNNGQYICMQAQWKTNGTVVEIKISAVFDHDDFGHSEVSAVLRDRSRSVFFGSTTVGTSCGNVTGFTGNKPLVALKSYPSNLISCGSDTLVVPPNYPNPPATCTNTMHGGKRGIKGFDPITGVSRCNNLILTWIEPDVSGDCYALPDGGGNSKHGAVTGINPDSTVKCSLGCNINNANTPDDKTEFGSCNYNTTATEACEASSSTLPSTCTFPDNSKQWCSGQECDCCTSTSTGGTLSTGITPSDNLNWMDACKPCPPLRAAVEPVACSDDTEGVIGWGGTNAKKGCRVSIQDGREGRPGRRICRLAYLHKITNGYCRRTSSPSICAYDSVNGCDSSGQCGCSTGDYCRSDDNTCWKSGGTCIEDGIDTGTFIQACPSGYECGNKTESTGHCPGSPTDCYQWSQ